MADDFFVNKSSDTDTSKKNEKIPVGYIPIKLSTLGKLNAPPVIHIRNFNLDEILELSLATEDNELETTVSTLNKAIYEGFDLQYLHEEELKEILVNIFSNFWGKTLKNYYYPYEEEELNDPSGNQYLIEKIKSSKDNSNNANKDNEEFYPKVSIEVENIKTITIQDDFKEPIIIKKGTEEAHFRLPRLIDVIKAKKYVFNKYLKEDQIYSTVINKIRQKKEYEIDPVMLSSYKQVQKNKLLDIARIIKASTIVQFNSKHFNDNEIDEKISYASKIPVGFWNKFSNISSTIKFGLDENVEVLSPITNKPVVRRFQFRFMDFIQSLELQDDSEFSVSFGN